jgi:hypothetical protein
MTNTIIVSYYILDGVYTTEADVLIEPLEYIVDFGE